MSALDKLLSGAGRRSLDKAIAGLKTPVSQLSNKQKATAALSGLAAGAAIGKGVGQPLLETLMHSNPEGLLSKAQQAAQRAALLEGAQLNSFAEAKSYASELAQKYKDLAAIAASGEGATSKAVDTEIFSRAKEQLGKLVDTNVAKAGISPTDLLSDLKREVTRTGFGIPESKDYYRSLVGRKTQGDLDTVIKQIERATNPNSRGGHSQQIDAIRKVLQDFGGGDSAVREAITNESARRHALEAFEQLNLPTRKIESAIPTIRAFSDHRSQVAQLKDIFEAGKSRTGRDLLEYLYTKAAIPTHERLVNATPLTDIAERAIKPADSAIVRMLGEGLPGQSSLYPKINSAQLDILRKNPQYIAQRDLLRDMDREYSFIQEEIRRRGVLDTFQPNNYFTQFSNPRLQSEISAGPFKTRISELVEAMRRIPAEQRAGIPDIDSVGALLTKGDGSRAATDIALNAAKKGIGTVRKIPVAKALDVLESAYKTYDSRGALEALDKYKSAIQQLERTHLPFESYRLPAGVPDLVDKLEEIGTRYGISEGAASVAKDYQDLAEGMTRGTDLAQKARYGINSPLIF